MLKKARGRSHACPTVIRRKPWGKYQCSRFGWISKNYLHTILHFPFCLMASASWLIITFSIFTKKI